MGRRMNGFHSSPEEHHDLIYQALLLILIILLYALIYGSFIYKDLRISTWVDALYYSCSQACVGFTNIYPQTDRAKLITMSQQIICTAYIMHIVVKARPGR